MMIRFLVYHIGCVFGTLVVARQSLAFRRDIPGRIRLYHYASLSFLVFTNVGGLSLAFWTVGRVLAGDPITDIEQHLIALRELPLVLAFAVWAYAVSGQCITTLLAWRVARSNGRSRDALLRLFPFLVLAQGMLFCITFRGSDGTGFVQNGAKDYAIAFCVWCVVAWPYVFVYRFFRGASSDVLFSQEEQTLSEKQAKNKSAGRTVKD